MIFQWLGGSCTKRHYEELEEQCEEGMASQ